MPKGRLHIADRHAIEFAKMADEYAATALKMFAERGPIHPGARIVRGYGHAYFSRSYLKRMVAHARAMRELRYWAGAASATIQRLANENVQLALLAEDLLDEKENEFLMRVTPVGQA